MRVVRRGPPPYRFAVVYCLHGNERFSKEAVDEILSEAEEFDKGVKFVFANERAYDENTRYIDEDLNRAFPGDRDSDSHEKRLAARLMDELEGTTVLDLHSTVSYGKPVAFIAGRSEERVRLALKTGVSKIVDVAREDGSNFFAGSLVEYLDGVAVECGKRGEYATKAQSKRVVENFLTLNGVTTYSIDQPDSVSLYRIVDRVDRPGFEFTAENFTAVSEGETYAVNGGEELEAERDFYPILMSSTGYDDTLGYRGEKVDEIGVVRQR